MVDDNECMRLMKEMMFDFLLDQIEKGENESKASKDTR
jgi:hypothetical protein